MFYDDSSAFHLPGKAWRQIREGTSKCLFSFFKKIGGDKHLD